MSNNLQLQIVSPESQLQLDAVRNLMRMFIAWHKERHWDQLDLVNAYFDEATFELELAALPGRFGAPNGWLCLATYAGEPAGCVGLRKISEDSCEMKRMFVDPKYQGLGIGKSLALEIISQARRLGYSRMVLDSGAKQIEAHALYRSLGFVDIAPYYELTEALQNWLVFMALDL